MSTRTNINKPRLTSASKEGVHPMLRLRSGQRELTPLDEDKALQICELVAAGHTLGEICEKYAGKLPTRKVFTQWMLMFPHVRQAYEAAQELRTYALEDEAMEAVREGLIKPSKVPAIRALITQLQWSMEKGNQNRYGQKGVGQITVPVQINTTMNLGQPGASDAVKPENIYEVSIPSGANKVLMVESNVAEEEPDPTPTFAGKPAQPDRWANKMPAKLMEDGEVNPKWLEWSKKKRQVAAAKGRTKHDS